MIRRPPRSTLFPLHDALPIFWHVWVVSVLSNRRDAEAAKESDVILNEVKDLAAWLQPRREMPPVRRAQDRKSTRLNSSHANISYAVFCLKKKQQKSVTVLR